MPCANLALYSQAFTPKNTDPKRNVARIQSLAGPALFSFAASKPRTIVTLEQISTNVLKAPTGSLM
jgi:hypothetical protein